MIGTAEKGRNPVSSNDHELGASLDCANESRTANIPPSRVKAEEGVRMFRHFALYSLACLLCGEAAAQAVPGGVCRPVS